MRDMMSMMVAVAGLRVRPRRSRGGIHDGADGAHGTAAAARGMESLMLIESRATPGALIQLTLSKQPQVVSCVEAADRPRERLAGVSSSWAGR